MKKEFFVEFLNADAAQKILNKIAARIGDTWDVPNVHPFEGTALFSWNTEQLRACEDLLQGQKALNLQEARKAGYTFGFHRGKFHQASQKIEDACFILDEMKRLMTAPNLPAYRSLYYGLWSALYGAITALAGSFQRIGGDAKRWWEATNSALKKEKSIQLLLSDYHADKHGHATSLLSSTLRMHEYFGQPVDVISGEGAYRIQNRGTPRERRVFSVDGVYELTPLVQLEEFKICGLDISSLPLNDQLEFVIWHFQDILHNAKTQFGP